MTRIKDFPKFRTLNIGLRNKYILEDNNSFVVWLMSFFDYPGKVSICLWNLHHNNLFHTYIHSIHSFALPHRETLHKLAKMIKNKLETLDIKDVSPMWCFWDTPLPSKIIIYSKIHWTVVLHPRHFRTLNEAIKEHMERMLTLPTVVGFGEIGLDYHSTP